MSRVLRVATWNVHEGLPAGIDHGPPIARVFDGMVDLINDLDIDVICFQEVDYTPELKSNTLNAVARGTALSHFAAYDLSPSSFFPGMRTGVAIASRFPLYGQKKTKLPNPNLTVRVKSGRIGSHDKGHLSAKVDLWGREVSIVSLHALPFHVFGQEAADPRFGYVWENLARGLTTRQDAPLLVCGDFNTPQRDLVLSDATTHLNRAVGDQPTFDDLALDDILYSRHFEERRTRVVPNFSDHRACVADLELAGSAP
jgi:endonuclease/exonuclease/phosphatase family metal-dependent hydrolase